MNVEEAREFIQARRMNRLGVVCPCCERLVRVYKRPLNSSMAASLVAIYRYFLEHTDWLHVPSYLKNLRLNGSNDAGLLVHWKLLEAKEGDRADGAKHNGHYKITDLGRAFVAEGIAIPKHVFLTDATFLGLSDETTTLRDALGEKFNYEELMRMAS